LSSCVVEPEVEMELFVQALSGLQGGMVPLASPAAARLHQQGIPGQQARGRTSVAPKAVIQLFHKQAQLVIVRLVTEGTSRPAVVLVVMLVVMLAVVLAPMPLLIGG
jgi:hypothetical protein